MDTKRQKDVEPTLTISLGIKKIKEIQFSLNEDVVIDAQDLQAVNLDIKQELSFDLDSKQVSCVVSVSFNIRGTQFMQITTNNVFEILELASFVRSDNPEGVNLPHQVVVTLISLSVSHTRALLARNAAGTKYENYYLPILDPKQLAQSQ